MADLEISVDFGSCIATAQSKTVTPTASGFDVTPDSGYLLKKVTINAIPTTRELNAYGGYTVTIGG